MTGTFHSISYRPSAFLRSDRFQLMLDLLPESGNKML